MSTIHFHARSKAVTIEPRDLHAVIEKCYVDRPDEWQVVSLDQFILRTEWAGYWVKGTALEAIRAAGQIRTPWAIFRIKNWVKP